MQNFGSSPARDLSVSFEPPLPTGDNAPELVEIVERYREPIGVLVPGMRLTNVYSHPHNPAAPERVRVRVSYKSDAKDPYGDVFELDVRQLAWKETYATETSSSYSIRVM